MLYKQINKKLVPIYVGEDTTDAYRYERLAVNLPETPTKGYKFIQDGYEVVENDYWTEKWIQVECEEQALLRDRLNSFKTFIDSNDVIAKLESSNIRDFNSLLFQLAQYLNVTVTDLSFATENYKNKLLLQIAEAVGISFTSQSVVDINSTDNLILSIGEKLNYNNLPINLQNYTTNQKRELVKRFFEELNPLLKTRKPLCFTAEEAGSTVRMSKRNAPPTIYLETSPTGEEGSWSDFIVGSTTITLPNVGDKVYFRAKQDNERFATSLSTFNYFVMTGKLAASGNLNTLLKADGSVLDLTGRDFCYTHMFTGCSSLTQAPELPATTLADYCYYYMFYNCSKLNSINVNFSAWNPINATTNWVSGVASSGTFTCPTSLSETYGISNIPNGWTVVRK